MWGDIPDTLYKIFLTLLMSGLIGFEREIRNKGAGLRTHILVGIGSALVVLTSLYLFDIYKNVTFIDPTRMIAGIVTGIGFLCAGTIIRAGNNVHGLDTAATLWIVSCIGMAIGAGHYTASFIVTIVVVFVLIFFRAIERKLNRSGKDEK